MPSMRTATGKIIGSYYIAWCSLKATSIARCSDMSESVFIYAIDKVGGL